MKLGLISFTARGRVLCERLARGLSQSAKAKTIIWDKSQMSLKTFVEDAFEVLDGVIFIGAIGIAVRVTAPLLKSKAQDPAVVVLDEAGRYVIPILSGHLGGANALARDIAALVGAAPVITTSTDVHGVFAVDLWSKKQGCEILEIDKIKAVSGALLASETVGLFSDFYITGEIPAGLTLVERGSLGICVSLSESKQPFEVTLHVVPKRVILGIGCRRKTAFEDLERFIIKTLSENDISLKAVSALHSIDLKQQEPGLIRFSETYGIPFKTFSAEALKSLSGCFERSEFVERITGVDNVCERSAMAVDLQGERVRGEQVEADLDGLAALSRRLIITKRQKAGMTLAAAIEDWRCEF